MNVPVLIIWRLHKYKKYKVEHSENEIYVLLYTELFFFLICTVNQTIGIRLQIKLLSSTPFESN